MPKFTTEDLLLFMYNEMNDIDKAAMQQEFEANWALREKMQVLKESEQRLQRLKLQTPRLQTIDAIMEYAAHDSEVNL